MSEYAGFTEAFAVDTDSDVAVNSCSPGMSAGEDSNVQPSRTRESLQDASATVISITQRVRERMYKPVPREADDAPERRRIAFRSPWTEDHASPRCIWDDHREAAADIAGEAAGVRFLFWAVAVIPLTLNMTFAAGHVATTRPGRFWGVVLIAVIIWLLAIR